MQWTRLLAAFFVSFHVSTVTCVAANTPTEVNTPQGAIELLNGMFPTLNPPSPSPDKKSLIGAAMERDFEQYVEEKYPGHLAKLRAWPSAVSICVDWSKMEYRDLAFIGAPMVFGRVSYSWHWQEKSTSSAQSDITMKQCRAMTRPDDMASCACQPFLGNMSLQMDVPRVEVERMSRDIPESYYGLERFSRATLSLLLTEASGRPPRDKQTGFVAVAPISPVTFAYPFSDREYSARCWRNHTYDYTKVSARSAPVARSIASALIGKGLYGCEKAEPDTSPLESSLAPSEKKSEEFCKYVYSQPLKNDEIADGSAEKQLSPTHAWIEVTARVQSDGRVLEIQPYTRPIGFETAEDLYLGFEILWPRPDWACAVNAIVPGREILEVNGCTSSDCIKNFQDRFLEGVQASLRNAPIGVNQGTPIGPNETLLTRDMQPSLVLGEPYYECSTYLVRPYSENEKSILSDALAASRGTGHGAHLYLNIAHIFTVTPNKLDSCSEPSRLQSQQYATAMATTLDKVVEDTCGQLHGSIEQSVCRITTSGGPSK